MLDSNCDKFPRSSQRSTRAKAVPRIEELKDGSWRLLWFGNVLRPAQDNLSGYELKAYFEWIGAGQRATEAVWLPLTMLPLLPLQSSWVDKAFSGLGMGHVRRFHVRTNGAELLPPWMPGCPEQDLLKRNDYRFHGIRDLAPCWRFATSWGDHLVVPAWEVLRAWYLFTPEIMPAVLAGTRHAHALPRNLRPWLEGTGSDGHTLQYVAPRWMSEAHVKRMARLIFDPIGSERAYDIYRQLMRSAATGDRHVCWPAVLPPYDGRAGWEVLCRRISPAPDGSPRSLVLRLRQATLPRTLTDLNLSREGDNRQGLNRDDPELPVKEWKKPAPVEIGPDGTMSATGGAPDRRVETVAFDGFDFRDSIDQTLKVHLQVKLLQSTRSRHLPPESIEVDGAATDAAGLVRPGHARATTEDSSDDERLPPVDVLRRTLQAFQRIVASNQTGQTSARLLAHAAPETLIVYPRRKCKVRHFAILEVRFGHRYVYALDAQRIGSERFRLMLCRAHDALPCSAWVFRQWLRNFPSPRGCPWTGDGTAPRALLYKALNHQPERQPVDHDRVLDQLAARLERELWRLCMQ